LLRAVHADSTNDDLGRPVVNDLCRGLRARGGVELAGGGGDPGQAGQRFRGGEASPAVADLGQQPGCPHGTRARQRGEDVRVGVRVELLTDLLGQGLDSLICATMLVSTASSARVMWAWVAPSEPVRPRGAAVSRACSTAGSTRPH
jgi:hypothetical protein